MLILILGLSVAATSLSVAAALMGRLRRQTFARIVRAWEADDATH